MSDPEPEPATVADEIHRCDHAAHERIEAKLDVILKELGMIPDD